jgi:hypothetical protein
LLEWIILGRRAAAPAPGTPKRLPVKLPDELALDLWAFCELHFGVAHNRVIEKAVRKFIDDELNNDERARIRFEEIRSAAATRQNHPLRIAPLRGTGRRKDT